MTALPPARTPSDYTGPWQPRWSPGSVDPALPPVAVVHDPRDQPAYTTTALAAHRPSHGQLAVHPTPLATAPAYLAHDLIRAQGKHLPLPPDTDPPLWLGNADASWRVAAAWTQALGISHYIVCRAHRISGRHLEHLMALRELTRIRLTLVISGPPATPLTDMLTAVPHHRIDTPEAARQHLHPPCTAPPAACYPWWEAAAFPGTDDEPWYQLPPRRTRREGPPPNKPTSSTRLPAQRIRPPAIALPRPQGQPLQLSCHYTVIAQRIHSRIAHPLYAAAVAIRALTGYRTDQLPELTAPTPSRARARLPSTLPHWATLLIAAARTYTALEGHNLPDPGLGLYGTDRPFRLSTWEQNDVERATETCRLTAASPPAPRRRARP